MTAALYRRPDARPPTVFPDPRDGNAHGLV